MSARISKALLIVVRLIVINTYIDMVRDILFVIGAGPKNKYTSYFNNFI